MRSINLSSLTQIQKGIVMTRLTPRARFAALSLIILLALASNSEAVTVHRNAAAPPPFKITALKTKLFFEGTGTFSQDILTQPDLALLDTIIGAGAAGRP